MNAWPWPADTPLDIARRLLQSYRNAVAELDSEVCDRLDAQARAVGQDWVIPRTDPIDPDDLLTDNELAEMLNLKPGVIRQWALRGYIDRRTLANGRRVYRLGDVLDFQARRRRHRAAHARDV